MVSVTLGFILYAFIRQINTHIYIVMVFVITSSLGGPKYAISSLNSTQYQWPVIHIWIYVLYIYITWWYLLLWDSCLMYSSDRIKGFRKRLINMANFLLWWCWKSFFLFVCCMCAEVVVHLNVCLWMCCRSCIYIIVCLLIKSFFQLHQNKTLKINILIGLIKNLSFCLMNM